MNMIKRLLKKFQLIRNRLYSPETYARHIGVTVGQGCFISTRNFSSEPYLIEIGNHVRIAGETSFFTHGGIWPLRKLYNDPKLDHFGKIKIGDYSYIGEKCMIMPGVTIGERCIVGGGSIVTKSVPDGCMVAGNPAKFIGYTDEFYHRLKEKHDTGTGKMNAKDRKTFLLSMPENLFEIKPFIKMPDTM